MLESTIDAWKANASDIAVESEWLQYLLSRTTVADYLLVWFQLGATQRNH